MRELVVSLDGLSPLREAAEANLPAAASLAELAGADAVRIAVREEGRGPSSVELRDLRRTSRTLELRMAPIPTLVKEALEVRPERVIFASEGRGEYPAATPLDFRSWGTALAPSVRTLEEAGIHVALVVAPDLGAVKAAHQADAGSVELYTGSLVDLPELEQREALTTLGDAARLAAKLRLRAGAGGRLGFRDIGRLLESAPSLEWIACGREWAGRAVLAGVDRATRDLRERVI